MCCQVTPIIMIYGDLEWRDFGVSPAKLLQRPLVDGFKLYLSPNNESGTCGPLHIEKNERGGTLGKYLQKNQHIIPLAWRDRNIFLNGTWVAQGWIHDFLLVEWECLSWKKRKSFFRRRDLSAWKIRYYGLPTGYDSCLCPATELYRKQTEERTRRHL